MSQATSLRQSPLTGQLRRLVHEFIQVRDDETLPSGTDPPPWRWQDDDYVYLEVNLSESAGLVADVSIDAGRALIRVAR